MKLFTAIALFWVTSISSAKDYDIPEISGALTLSNIWIPVSAAVVKEHNEDMIGKRPGTKCRYIVGFMRGKPPTDFYSSQEYLWIQLTPMPLGSITPEQMVAVYPKPASQLQKQYETMLKYKVEPGLARYDERLGAIVYDAAFPEADGKIRAVMRSFTVLTGTQAIGIVAYSRPEHAEMTFEEARGVASTLTLKEREQVPTAWKERLKQLLKASP